MRSNRENFDMIVAAEVLNQLSQMSEVVDGKRLSSHSEPSCRSKPESGMATEEEWLALVKRMLDVAPLVRGHIEQLEDRYAQELKTAAISELAFVSRSEETVSMFLLWVNYAVQVLQVADDLDATEQSLRDTLRTDIAAVESELKARSDSQRGIDAFLASRPLPEGWNAELVERNMEAVARGEGTDMREYLAALPR